jgi:hypothetical protein
MNVFRSSVIRWARAALAGVLPLLLASAPLQAATTISNTPLILNVSAAPNVLMILDNSGSMNWESLPDDFNDQWSLTTSIRAGTRKVRSDPGLQRREHPECRDAREPAQSRLLQSGRDLSPLDPG